MATALVTGASRGIGRAVALALARDGHDVAVAYASNAGAAEEVAGAIRGLGRRAPTCGADLADPAAAGVLVDAVEDGLGPVEILVANAGVNTPGRRVEEIALEERDRLHAVNLRAPFLLARRVLPGMEARGFGRVVLLSSVAAYTGGIIGAHYASSKAGLHGLAHSQSQQAAGAGVTVNVVAPALIESDMLPAGPGDRDRLPPAPPGGAGGARPGGRDRLAASLPVGRLGTAEEVADLVAAVVRNGFVTNQSFLVDGGLH